jgi:hypothetical protein
MLGSLSALDGDHPAGVCNAGNGIEQRRVDPTKDGAAGGNAQSQREYRDERKSGRTPQLTQRVAQVMP